MGFWRILLGADIVGDDDDDFAVSKGIVASDASEAKSKADKIARKEGIQGELSLEEKSDMSGGKYYSATWRKGS